MWFQRCPLTLRRGKKHSPKSHVFRASLGPTSSSAIYSFSARNRRFTEWGEDFGDPVVATAQLDRRLHHAVVVQIEGAQLPAAPTCRPDPRAHTGPCQHCTAAPAETTRPATKNRKCQSQSRLIAEPARWGILLQRFWRKLIQQLHVWLIKEASIRQTSPAICRAKL